MARSFVCVRSASRASGLIDERGNLVQIELVFRLRHCGVHYAVIAADMATDWSPASEAGWSRAKTPTAAERRLISLLSRSSGLVDQIFFQCGTGKSAKAVMSAAASCSMDSTLGSWRPSVPAMVSSCPHTCSASGWAKMVRTAHTPAQDRRVPARFQVKLDSPDGRLCHRLHRCPAVRHRRCPERMGREAAGV